jgi:hypothetical protein
MYAIINFGGLTPIVIHVFWNLHIPHVYLIECTFFFGTYLKIMTRDNLKKGIQINLNVAFSTLTMNTLRIYSFSALLLSRFGKSI